MAAAPSAGSTTVSVIGGQHKQHDATTDNRHGGTEAGTSRGQHMQHDATTGNRRRNELHYFAELSDRSATTDEGATDDGGTDGSTDGCSTDAAATNEGGTDAAATDAAASHEGATDEGATAGACHKQSGGGFNPTKVAFTSSPAATAARFAVAVAR